MKNNFIMQVYLESTGTWMDLCAFPTISEAICFYTEWKNICPNSTFRIGQLFKMGDEK